MKRPSRMKVSSRLDVEVATLIEALNDSEKAEKLMRANNWSKKDLIARAELLSKELAASIAAVNVV